MVVLLVASSLGCARQLAAPERSPDELSVRVTESTSDTVVEYVRVDGQACLQPRVIAGSPEDDDLVRAQHRWLAKAYPGYRLVRQSHVLTLAPEFRPAGQEDEESHGEHDSIEFESAKGEPISECFGLKVPGLGDEGK